MFGLYILAFYAAALYGDSLEKWNKLNKFSDKQINIYIRQESKA